MKAVNDYKMFVRVGGLGLMTKVIFSAYLVI